MKTFCEMLGRLYSEEYFSFLTEINFAVYDWYLYFVMRDMNKTFFFCFAFGIFFLMCQLALISRAYNYPMFEKKTLLNVAIEYSLYLWNIILTVKLPFWSSVHHPKMPKIIALPHEQVSSIFWGKYQFPAAIFCQTSSLHILWAEYRSNDFWYLTW